MGCVPTVKRQGQTTLRDSQILAYRRGVSPSHPQYIQTAYNHPQSPLRVSNAMQPLPSLRGSQVMLPNSPSILSSNTMLTSQSSYLAQSPPMLSSIMQPAFSYGIPLPSQTSITSANSMNEEYFPTRRTIVSPRNFSGRKDIVSKTAGVVNDENF